MATISEFINKIGFQVKKEDVQKVNETFNGIKSTATRILGVIGIGLSLSSANALIEEFTRVKDQIKNSTKGLGEQAEIQDKILAAASATRSEYSQTASMVSNLVKENSELFGTVDEAIKFNNAATMLFKTAGKTNAEIAGLMTAINKSFAKGYVDSETLNQMLEKSPEAVELLNKQLGTTSDQLEQLARDGKFTVQDLKAAFVNNAQSIEKSFKGVQMTVSDALTVIRNRWGLWLADTNQMLGVTNTIGNIMVTAFDKFLNVMDKVRSGIKWLSDKVGGFKNLLKLLSIVAGTLFVAFKFNKIKTGLMAFKTLLTGIKAKTLGVAAVIILLALLVEDFINFLNGNNSLIGEFLEKSGANCDEVREKFSQLGEVFKQIWDIVVQLGSALLSVLADALGTILSVLMELIAAILPIVLDLLLKLIPVCVQIIQMILPVLLQLIRSIMPIITKIIQNILPPLLDLISAIIPPLMEIIDRILPIVIELVNLLLPILMVLVETLLPVIVELLDAILPIIGPILEIVTSLVLELLPVIITLLDALIPIIKIIFEVLKPVLDLVVLIVDAIAKVIGWIADGLSWVVELFFGGDAGKKAKSVAAYADGTDYSEDTFVAGEEGPELITNQRGKKVFTAVQTGEIFHGLAKLTTARTPTPQTASVVTSTTDRRKNIVQNVEINNKFEGDTAIQKKASTAMDKSAKDVTSELARGLAYT